MMVIAMLLWIELSTNVHNNVTGGQHCRVPRSNDFRVLVFWELPKEKASEHFITMKSPVVGTNFRHHVLCTHALCFGWLHVAPSDVRGTELRLSETQSSECFGNTEDRSWPAKNKR